MDKIEYRAVIKLFVKEGLTPNEIHPKFINVYGDSSPSFSTIKQWAAEFKRGRTSLEVDPREGHPKSAATPEIIEQVHDMLLDDGRIKVREIAETIGISKERVRYILHEELYMKKLCARWVPHLLTADQKHTRMKISNSAWSVLTKIKLILCVDLLLCVRLGFTITHQNPNSSENSEQKPVFQHQRRQGRFHQKERSWHRCFGMLKAFS
jgi:histone-lysine N-methyltransferase SETMAR